MTIDDVRGSTDLMRLPKTHGGWELRCLPEGLHLLTQILGGAGKTVLAYVLSLGAAN